MHTKLDALLSAYCRKNLENSELVDNEGWTEIMVSEDRYAIRATVPSQSASGSSKSLHSDIGLLTVAGCGIPASPALRMEAIVTPRLGLATRGVVNAKNQLLLHPLQL